MRRRRLHHGVRVLLMSLAAGFPGVITALVFIWRNDVTPKVAWSLTVLISCSWLFLSLLLREQVVTRLNTISSLLAALREGDFSIRGRLLEGNPNDPFGIALSEINALGETLREQRLGAHEATALLRKVTAEIDVAVFAFDSEQRLRLANRAGEKLLGRLPSQIFGHSASDLGMTPLLTGETPRTVYVAFAGGTGPWELRRSAFRQDGLPHELVVLCDLERALRQEEREAWQRLVRVLGHEINNSLAPIRSLAVNLQDVLVRRPSEWEDDVTRGLAVIARRSDALNRFMTSYARLARLPPPTLGPLNVGAWVHRIVELEKRLKVEVIPGPDVVVQADGDQLDQVLINLLQNAVDASLEMGGGVRVEWNQAPAAIEVLVIDDGPGLPQTENLFVPFFTTKPNGSGIGLALSRQIAEGHRGKLALQNRTDARGCVARLLIPYGGEPREACSKRIGIDQR